MTAATRAQTSGAFAMIFGTGVAFAAMLGLAATIAPTIAAMM
ncbi:hypothetical protein [Pontixanthobacter sp. CEM42]|nr:hypothetical protein [Pontixanthobacter sp. CEM42]